jgi:hypothetical protein
VLGQFSIEPSEKFVQLSSRNWAYEKDIFHKARISPFLTIIPTENIHPFFTSIKESTIYKDQTKQTAYTFVAIIQYDVERHHLFWKGKYIYEYLLSDWCKRERLWNRTKSYNVESFSWNAYIDCHHQTDPLRKFSGSTVVTWYKAPQVRASKHISHLN